jgi:hypothetical protein
MFNNQEQEEAKLRLIAQLIYYSLWIAVTLLVLVTGFLFAVRNHHAEAHHQLNGKSSTASPNPGFRLPPHLSK